MKIMHFQVGLVFLAVRVYMRGYIGSRKRKVIGRCFLYKIYKRPMTSIAIYGVENGKGDGGLMAYNVLQNREIWICTDVSDEADYVLRWKILANFFFENPMLLGFKINILQKIHEKYS